MNNRNRNSFFANPLAAKAPRARRLRQGKVFFELIKFTNMKNQRDSFKDLHNEDAVQKIKDLVDHNSLCFFTTSLDHLPLQSRPMSTMDVDDQGNLYFLSSITSNKNMQLQSDPRVQLFFGNKGSSEFLSIYGEARIFTDRKSIEDVWAPIAKIWFQEGKDDPEVSVIQVTPIDAYYWDTKNNKAVSLIKMAASFVAGVTMDDGVEGKLKVNQSDPVKKP
jgi:general stress protein 26